MSASKCFKLFSKNLRDNVFVTNAADPEMCEMEHVNHILREIFIPVRAIWKKLISERTLTYL